ncbi:MAG: alpha/beta family hydrolase [Solirubrobacteraceae bacterium]
MTRIDIETPRGPARVRLHRVREARGALLLGHGAGGGVDATDLQAASEAAQGQGFSVALVEQPYRVAGRRSPAPAAHLDVAWLEVVARLRARELRRLPLIFGGRSMGARVACRTAPAGGAAGVLCLAFPLVPPQRAKATKPPASRLDELEATGVPTLVVQGSRDRFGMPPPSADRLVVTVAGDHSLRTDLANVATAVGVWLAVLPLAP